MPDREKTRLGAFAADTRTRIVPPGFDELCTVARRRRRTAVTASAAAVALAVLGTGLGLKAGYGNQTAPVGPAHTTSTGAPTTPTQPTQRTTKPPASRADAIIDSPNAFPEETAVLPDDPGAMAVLWRLNNSQASALAVTDDGFTHRTSLLLRGSELRAAGHDFVINHGGSLILVSPDGQIHSLTRQPQAGPLGPDEYLADRSDGTVAVNPTTGTFHRLSLPANAHEVFGGQGLIWTLVFPTPGPQEILHNTLAWSTDGGRTWSSHPLPSGKLMVMDAIPSPPGTMAVTVIGDGNTIPTLHTSVVSRDGGASWQTVHEGRNSQVPFGWVATVPDGRLLVGAFATGHLGTDRNPALVASTGSDWSRLKALSPHLANGRPFMIGGGELATTTTDDGTFVLYVTYGEQMWRSDDGGLRWSEVEDR